MSRVTVDRDHYDVVWSRPEGAVSGRALSGIKAAMTKAMYEPNDLVRYSGVSRTVVISLITEEGYAYSRKTGKPKDSAQKLADLFTNKSVEDLFGPPPKSGNFQKPEPSCG